MNQPGIAPPKDWTDHFRGDFEIHVTVAAATPAEHAALSAWADARGVKFSHIVLARGVMASQPMLTARTAGTLGSVSRAADMLVAGLGEADFDVVRMKIEASPHADGVPATAVEADALPAEFYFEHHVKLVLEPGADEAALVALAVAHDAHVSRNARRSRSDGCVERFVTQRCRLVGRDEAGERLGLLTAALADAGLEIASVEREYVVHDSAPAVDAGWIEAKGDKP